MDYSTGSGAQEAGEDHEAFDDPDLDRNSDGEPEKEELEALLEILTEVRCQPLQFSPPF